MSKSDTLYTIIGGRVERSLIPPEGVVLYKEGGKVNSGYLALSSKTRPEHADWQSTMEFVVNIGTTITPWVTWYACPALPADDTIDTAGQAYIWSEKAVVRSSLGPQTAIQVVLHEAWHMAEDYLSWDELEVINKGIGSLPEIGQGAWKAYYCSAQEVRANAFAAWAYSYWLRGRTPEYRRGMPADERIWSMVYRGDLGRRVARRGLIPAHRQPPHIQAFLSQRGDFEKIWDGIRYYAIAAWRALSSSKQPDFMAKTATEIAR